MRIQVMSDLHTEFMKDGGKCFIDSLDPTNVDVLTLAGDVGLASGDLTGALSLLCEKYPHVVFVLGNHDYYGSSKEDVFCALGDFGAKTPNFHWLENNAVTIDGQRFIGCTLWFPSLSDGLNSHYSNRLNDFFQIVGFRKWVYHLNGESMHYLTTNIQPGDVVITHHIPTLEGVHPKWLPTQGSLGRFFLCQMPRELFRKPACWVYGHTHDTMCFEADGCLFYCNPFGYARVAENPRFIEKLVVGGTDIAICDTCGHEFELPSEYLELHGGVTECPKCCCVVVGRRPK